MIEFLAVVAAAILVLVLLLQRRGAFRGVEEDDSPGDGIAEHMDGLGDRRTSDRLVGSAESAALQNDYHLRGGGGHTGGGF